MKLQLQSTYRPGVEVRAEGKETVFRLADTGDEFRSNAKSGADAIKAFAEWIKARA